MAATRKRKSASTPAAAISVRWKKYSLPSRPQRLAPLRQPASQLALRTGGWAVDAGFVALAIGTLLVAYILARTLGTYKSVPIILLAIAGVLGFIPAFVPTDPNGVAPTTHGLIHNLNGLVTFVLYVGAMIGAAFAFRSAAYWRPLQKATALFAGAGVVGFFLLVALGAANLFGLGERLAIGVWVAWLLLIAWRGAMTPATHVANRL